MVSQEPAKLSCVHAQSGFESRWLRQAFNAKGLRPPVSVALYGRVSIIGTASV